MSEAITCEACDRGYRLNPDGLHYNDDAGGATWGICRKVTTTNHPTPELLSDEQVTRMQTRVDNNEPLRLYLAEFGIDVPALCATVRAAWAEIATLKGHWADTSEDLASAWERRGELESENTALRDQLAELQRRNDTQAESIMEFQAGEKSLRAQLVQVEQELTEEKRLRSELKHIAQIGIEEVSSVGSALQANAVRDATDRAATRMRDKCMEKVKAQRAEKQAEADAKRDPDNPREYHGSYGLAVGAVDVCDDLITDLQSLTLDQVERKQS